MRARTRFATVASYIAVQPPESARVLRKLCKLVAATVPESRAAIGYNIPAFTLGKTFMFCAAFKSHIGVYPPVRTNAALQKALAPYSNDKGNLRFPLAAPIPYALIARVAKALAKQYADSAKVAPKKQRRQM